MSVNLFRSIPEHLSFQKAQLLSGLRRKRTGAHLKPIARRACPVNAHRRTYSLDHVPNSRQFLVSEMESLMHTPSSLKDVKHIAITTNDDLKDTSKTWEPSQVIRTLHSMKSVESITIDVFAMTEPQITHVESYPHDVSEDPFDSFDDVRSDWTWPSLCTWYHPQLPKLLVTHIPTSRALDACHPYRYDKAGWKAYVAANLHRPEIPAFDYSAEFYRRDLSGPGRGGIAYGEEEYLDLLPLGSGWQYPCGFESLQFAISMRKNILYFSRYPSAWKPDLYERLIQRGYAFSSLDSQAQDRSATNSFTKCRELADWLLDESSPE